MVLILDKIQFLDNLDQISWIFQQQMEIIAEEMVSKCPKKLEVM
jgi:hypothetical protein